MKKRILLSVLAITLGLSSFAIGAYSASNVKEVKAFLDSNLKIAFKGKDLDLKDSAGKSLPLLTYNGTIYAPIKSFAAETGTSVETDAKTGKIYLGGRNRVAKCPITTQLYGNDLCWPIKNKDDLSVTPEGADSPVNFKNGIIYKLWNSDWSEDSKKAIQLNVEGYERMTATVFCEENSNLYLYDGNKKIVSIVYIPAKKLLPIDIDVTGMKSIGIGGNGAQHYDHAPYIKVLDIQLEAVNGNSGATVPDTVSTGTSGSKTPKYLVTSQTTGNDLCFPIKNKNDLSVTPENADTSVKFSNGITYKLWNSDWSEDSKKAIMFNVDGYKQMTATAYCDEDCKVIIYNKNRDRVTEIEVKAKTPTPIDVDITDLKSVAIGANGSKHYNYAPLVKIFDIKVQ